MIGSRTTAVLTAVLTATLLLVGMPTASAIVGGSQSTAGQYPYLVSLQRSGHHSCGGSILDENTVLTAAHCVDGVSADRLTVRAGSLDQTTGGQLVPVSRVTVHPAYNASTIANDVAILKLAKPLVLGADVAAIDLPDAKATGAVQTAGWGRTAWQVGGSPRLQKHTALQAISNADCATKYTGVNTIDASMLCTADTATGTCQGDSGGPAVQVQKGRLVQVGITSYGIKCADQWPAVFADVAHLRGWIDAIRGGSTRAAAAAAAARTTADAVGADHGCPFDSVCLYATTATFENSEPTVIEDLALESEAVFAFPAGQYAEVVNNTTVAPEYAAQGTVLLGLLGTCVFVPEDTEGAGTETALSPLGINTVVVSDNPIAVDSLVIPCP